jgi:uncharacterized phage protein (TIGR02218 family)
VSFNQYEKSVEDSRPVELITLTVGGDVTRICSAEDDITVGGVTYTAHPLERDDLKVEDGERNALKLTVSADLAFVANYVSNVPAAEATVQIYRLQRADGTEEVVSLYRGYVSNVKFTQAGRVAELAINPMRKMAKRPAPRCKYSGQCNNVLYDDLCGVTAGDPSYTHSTGTVSSITGFVYEVSGAAAFGDGFFAGGTLENAAGGEARMVIAHTGNNLTVTLPLETVAVGDLVTVRAGCGHTVTDCHSKFNNLANFGGFPFVPSNNPFTDGIEPRNC